MRIPSSARETGAFAGAGSAFLLVAAFGFQFAGYAPCELCILQRWPHLAAAIIGLAVWLTKGTKLLLWAGLLSAMAAFALAAHHSGVEWGWWAGPVACSGAPADLTTLSAAELMSQIRSNTNIIRCDLPALKVFGFTMANMNAIASLVVTGIWAMAIRRAS